MIRDHTLHKKGNPDTFPCQAKVLPQSSLDELTITLALWQDLRRLPRPPPANSARVAYEEVDGNGASADVEFVHRDPRQLHVLL